MKEQRDSGAEAEENPPTHPEIPAPRHPDPPGAAAQAKRRPAYRNLRVWSESFVMSVAGMRSAISFATHGNPKR